MSKCKMCKACKGSKYVGVAVFPDSGFIVDTADSADEDIYVFVAISLDVCPSLCECMCVCSDMSVLYSNIYIV